MTKFSTGRFLLSFSSLWYWLAAVSEAGFCFFISNYLSFLGFTLGLIAFGLAFSGLEMILQRVIQVGAVKQGVFDSFLWLILKFCGPLACFYIGVQNDCPAFLLFLGMVIGLVNVSYILFLKSHSTTKKS